MFRFDSKNNTCTSLDLEKYLSEIRYSLDDFCRSKMIGGQGFVAFSLTKEADGDKSTCIRYDTSSGKWGYSEYSNVSSSSVAALTSPAIKFEVQQKSCISVAGDCEYLLTEVAPQIVRFKKMSFVDGTETKLPPAPLHTLRQPYCTFSSVYLPKKVLNFFQEAVFSDDEFFNELGTGIFLGHCDGFTLPCGAEKELRDKIQVKTD